MEENPWEEKLKEVTLELRALLMDGDPTDLDVTANILAKTAQQENLEYQSLKWQNTPGSLKAAEIKHRMLMETRKRAEAAEAQRKNKLLPLILKRLDDMESGASAVRDRANAPEFLAEDET